MKNIILILISCITLSGCSLLPKINFNTDGTTPQEVNKSKVKQTCKGDALFNEAGEMISCSKSSYIYLENYEKKERKYTLKEKIINIFRNFSGSMFWIAIALLIFCPSLLGMIAGRIVEGAFGISRKALNATVKGIQKARKEDKSIDDALSASQDEKIKKFIRKIKEEGNLK